jgi:outer membrane lipoprotein carrier protein
MNNNIWTRMFTVGCFILCASAAATSAETLDEAIASVENHYRQLHDLTAKVTQNNLLKSIGKTQKFEGTLWINKPGKLRLEYTNGQIILIDGKVALLYSKKSEQVIKKAFTDFEQMNIPVAFLLGAAHIRDDFEVFQPDAKTLHLLELRPKKEGAAMKKLRIQIEEAGRIIGLSIFDKSGNVTEINFSDIREDTGFDSKLFTFKAPKGTEIIEQ